MELIVMYVIAALSICVIGYMLVKKMDIKITLFIIGLVLMYVAIATGHGLAIKDFKPSSTPLLDPLLAIIAMFKSTLTGAGLVMLFLGGYTSYMSSIGANDATVSALAKPIAHVRSPYILVPIVFLLGNLLSLVVPSASNLAIILLATLYPVLRKSGMSALTAAAVIATTATIMPTPLGADNVAITAELAKYPMFENLTVSQYVFGYHALVSIPTLIFMAVVHYFWQKFMSKRADQTVTTQNSSKSKDQADEAADRSHTAQKNSDTAKDEIKGVFHALYAVLPLLPIVLLVVAYIAKICCGVSITMSVELATLISFIIALVCDALRRKDMHEALGKTETFFKGMGSMLPIIALLVAAMIYVVGLKSIGLIASLEAMMTGMSGNGLGFVLPLILVGLTALIVLLSGSGVALFYAMVPLIPALAQAAGISPIAVSIPMGMAGNLLRAVSPVSAVIMIVSGTTKTSPLDVVKRVSVPMLLGCVFMFVLSMVLFI